MEQDHLLIEAEGPILTLTLNRPERLNSFSEEMITSLTEALREAQNSGEIKVIILKGAGRSFSAGGDVKTMGQATPQDVYEHIGKLNRCILTMKETEIPIIAAVHGFAAGAGFNLAMACDLIVAAENSKFALSFSQVGLISDGGGSYFLPKLIGPHLAKQFFFSAEPIPAERLYQLGVINYLSPLERIEEEVGQLAAKLANGPVGAYGKMKKLIDASYQSTLEEMLEQERLNQTLMITTEDHQEGISAFKEKRQPVFTGK
ncbi:enoyl-CoA hydratase [Fictibacillus enclensis]|uniref:enoyl-CoA hydratase/isomerase family protein n=1 Tax=Fictibacillus TaxID=1329200 RepID=UPI0010107E02|nr:MULTISPECIES: enoyl-CoA hydratase [Fictibacillus]MDM5338403.1 enoyl-CoA hydratase [Fictibacillus enclensis]RXY98964.1 enoyl-CoA hydratase [Fictibacillus sp. S7]WHY74770.1 enoyl-CoA hydratase [Fictibacillus enclensis]